MAFAQSDVGGSWYGKAEAMLNGNHNSYLTELIIRQKDNKVEGILGYYFRNGYRSLYVHGKYNKKTREFVIKGLPLTYFRAASIDGVDCKMDLYGTMRVSKVKSEIDAVLVSNDQYKYTCPELKITFTRDESEENQDSVINQGITRRLWQPQPYDVVVTAGRDQPVSTQVTEARHPVYQQPSMDSLASNPQTAASNKIDALMASFRTRAKEVSKEISVESDSIRVSFYDNGTIDGDSISVFVNNVPVLTGQELGAEAVNIYLRLDSSLAVNEITMFAENLGRYPPNTALMVVNDGGHRHEIFLSSSLNKSATVRIISRKKAAFME